MVSAVVAPSGSPTNLTVSPVRNLTGSPVRVAVVRISGPLVSIITATELSARRVFSTMVLNPSRSRWAEFMRTTFIPAWARLRMYSVSHRLSDTVATILVNFIMPL